MRKFFKNLFLTKKKDKVDKNDILEEGDESKSKKAFNKLCQVKSLFKELNEGTDMDKFSKIQQKRSFKMNKEATHHLQESIIAKNKHLINELQQRYHEHEDYQNDNHQYDDIIHEQMDVEDNFTYKKQLTTEDQIQNKNDYYKQDSYKNNDNNNNFNNKNIKNEKVKFDINKKLQDFTISKKVTFADQQISENVVQKGEEKPIGRQSTASTNQFTSESEVYQGYLSKKSTINGKYFEFIQNNYLESVFISEDEDEDDDEIDEDEGENEGNQVEIEVQHDEDFYNKIMVGIKEYQKEERERIQKENNQQSEISKKQYIQDSILGFISTKKETEEFSPRNSIVKEEGDKEETIIKQDQQQLQYLNEELKESLKNQRKKIYRKRKRHDLTAIPDEVSSFQITYQKGKKKFINNGLAQNVNVLNLSKNMKDQSQSIHSYQSFLDSKSNLHNLIPEQSRNNIFSLYQNCSDVYHFSQINNIIAEFQYKKQETLVYHSLNDFKFIANIGKGSFGQVDLYEFIPLKFPIAVKTIKNVEEFARELYLMECLESIYMPRLFYQDETEMKLFMEVGLCSLEDYRKYQLETDNYLNDDQAFAILSQIIIAIQIFIDQKAFHSDIKPQNIVFKTNIDENKKIKLQLMIIDYGGASFDLEDYWIYYTPAFVCLPLWEKILESGQVECSQDKPGMILMNSQNCYSCDMDYEKKIDEDSINLQRINSFQRSLSQQLQSINISKSHSIIQPVYQDSQKKQNNLQQLDQQATMSKSQSTLQFQQLQQQQSLLLQNQKQKQQSQILSSSNSNSTQTTGLDNQSDPNLHFSNNNNNNNLNYNNQNNQFKENINYQNQQNKSQNKNVQFDIQSSNDFKIQDDNSFQQQEIHIIQGNERHKQQRLLNTIKEQYNEEKQEINESQQNYLSMSSKYESLNNIQRQLESMQKEWTQTFNLNYDKNNERNSHDKWLTWDEIRYSEIYAACRSVQYLILRKEDQELFKKVNIQQFMLKYHKIYPKTLKLMYKIFAKIEYYSLTQEQLNYLFSKTNEDDYTINIDPQLIFNISPLNKSLNLIKGSFLI